MKEPERPTPEFLALQAAVVGRYSLVRELGRGGMGIVFLARDVALDRLVAIKLLAAVSGNDAAGRARFLREARTAARLSHPHIVPIHTVEEAGEFVFFVMAYVDGETLATRVAREGPLDVAVLHRLAREVAWALGHAHAQGVVHRDIKPENVLIERDTGRALVADFGIAQSVHAPLSTTEPRVAGTPRYMSPEQLSADALDGRSDLYSLGLVITFAATAEAPPTVMARLQGASYGIAPAGAAGVLADVAARCTAIDPGARFSDAGALLRALDELRDAPRAIRPYAAGFLAQARAHSSEIATAFTASGLALGAVWSIGLLSESNSIFLAIDQAVFGVIAFAAGALGLSRGVGLIAMARQALTRGESERSLSETAKQVPFEAGGAATAATVSPRRLAATLGLGIASTALAALAYSVDGLWFLSSIGLLGIIVAPTATVRSLFQTLAARKGTQPLGWLTRAALRVGRIGMKSQPTPVVAEPTAAATAQIAVELLRALPAGQREAFAGVETLVRRLERAAVALRDSRNPDAAARRSDVDTALETIRLDLLRLHFERDSDGSTSAALDEAMRVGDEVLRQLEARREVDRLVEPE